MIWQQSKLTGKMKQKKMAEDWRIVNERNQRREKSSKKKPYTMLLVCVVAEGGGGGVLFRNSKS
jgi:hypothetical protein